MPTNRLAYTKTSASQPASEGMLPASNPANYGNATSKVINLYNNTWLSDSVVFTVDSAWRYVVHIRNTNYGASSIHIDDVRVYGKNTASYLLCGSGGEGYRFGFGGQEKENNISGVEGGHLSYQYRIHDARLGRFLSVDPLAPEYPWNSTYAFAENTPIAFIDLEGLERYFAADGSYLGKLGTSNEIRTVTDKDILSNYNYIKSTKHGEDWIYFSSKRFTESEDKIQSNIALGIYNKHFGKVSNISIEKGEDPVAETVGVGQFILYPQSTAAYNDYFFLINTLYHESLHSQDRFLKKPSRGGDNFSHFSIFKSQVGHWSFAKMEDFSKKEVFKVGLGYIQMQENFLNQVQNDLNGIKSEISKEYFEYYNNQYKSNVKYLNKFVKDNPQLELKSKKVIEFKYE